MKRDNRSLPVPAEGRSTGLAKREDVPDIVVRGKPTAQFAWDEFFGAQIANDHTRKAYMRAVVRFLEWCDRAKMELHTIAPADVGQYMQQLPGEIASKKQQLAGM